MPVHLQFLDAFVGDLRDVAPFLEAQTTQAGQSFQVLQPGVGVATETRGNWNE